MCTIVEQKRWVVYNSFNRLTALIFVFADQQHLTVIGENVDQMLAVQNAVDGNLGKTRPIFDRK